MKSFLRKGRGVRGVIVSTEIILILAAVVILAFVAALGLGRTVLNQAISTKSTVVINNPQGWYFVGNRYSLDNIFVTFHVTNLGDKPIMITNVKVILQSSDVYYEAAVNKQVNPGETISLTVKLSKHGSGTPIIRNTETLIVTYRDASHREGRISQPIPMTQA